MPLIREGVVVTSAADGSAHIVPLGAQELDLGDGAHGVLLQPFRPSTALDNLLRARCATFNHVDDVRVIAGCLTGRYRWPTLPAATVACARLEAAVAHWELEVDRVEDDPQRPRVYLRVRHVGNHRPFPGFNRAKAAVIEGAILVSRLRLIPAERIDREIDYLRIAIEKTAGPEEWEAWGWLLEAIARFRADAGGAAR